MFILSFFVLPILLILKMKFPRRTVRWCEQCRCFIVFVSEGPSVISSCSVWDGAPFLPSTTPRIALNPLAPT